MSRRGYSCSSVIANCILLRSLSYPFRWYDLELMFRMCKSKMSEVFWELAESMYEKHKKLITALRYSLMSQRAAMYANKIRLAGAMLPRCVRFIDITKIQMFRK